MARVAWAWANILLPSKVDHRPSTPRATLATTRWVWRWGSRARLVRWTNSPATSPVVGSWVTCPARVRRTPSRGPLEVARGLGHGGEVAVDRPGRRSPRGEQVEEAHRLRCAEGEVEAGHAPGPHRCAQRASRPGVAALEHLAEDRRGHRAAHAQVGEAGTEPGAGGLTGHPGPLGPAGDQVVDVVVVAAGSDHVDREHVRRCAAGLAGDLAGERGSSLPSGRPGAERAGSGAG